MKNLVIVTLLVVATIGQVFGQATREQISVADREISKAGIELKKAEKSFESEKAKKLAELKRDYRKTEIAGNRSENKTEIDAALKATKKLQSQIDSISALTANANMYAKQTELKKWQDKKTELLAQFMEVKASKKTLANADTTKSAKSDPVALNIKKKSAKADDSSDEEAATKPAKEPKEKADIYDRKIPTEVNRIDYKQRERSYDLRGSDLLLTKIEQNINSAISPGGQEGGYKVIFDNQYIEPVDFKVFRLNGEQYTSVMINPGVKRIKYFLPGKYVVQFYVAGKPSGAPRPLTIDGKTYDYNGESCFNFAYMPRFAN
ncbi:MAG: hypothetical protein WCW61_04295 [Patescibacteria group bacterium]